MVFGSILLITCINKTLNYGHRFYIKNLALLNKDNHLKAQHQSN